MTGVEDLHLALFDFVPKKPGAAYERIAALMMAALGWSDVRHDERARGDGRFALHQLDVTATHPTGSVQRFVVECKDYDKAAGKDVLDKLVGVRDQLGADAAAAVTTVGFTKGARDVAADEDVALIRMRPYDPEAGPDYVRVVEFVIDACFPERTNFDFSVEPHPALESAAGVPVGLSANTNLRHRDGTPAETFGEVLEKNAAPLQEGTFDCVAALEGGRVVRTANGYDLIVTEIRWTETVRVAPQTIRVEAKGEPCLVMEQLHADGSVADGKVLADRDLFAWTVGEDGDVVARQLPTGDDL